MAKVTLTDTQSRARFFDQSILINMRYWQTWVEDKIADIAALDRKRNGVVRAISFALDFEEAWPFVRELIETFSPYMERRGYWDTWNWVLSRAIKIANRLGDVEGVATLSALFARLLRRQSRFRESTVYYRQAIRMSRQIGDHFNEARACTNLGYYYIDHGRWHRGEVLCCHALTIFEQLDNNYGQAHTENHLGILYTEQCLWNKAQQHLERACAIWESMGDDHGLMHGYINLGKLFYDMDCANEALFYQEKARENAELTGDKNVMGLAYMNIGIVHILRNELTEAETYLRQAKAIFQRLSSTRNLIHVREYLGALFTKQQKWSKAIFYLETALEAWRSLGHKYSEIRTMISLMEYELAQGNQQQATARLKEIESFFDQYDPTGRYCQLHRQVDKIRYSLTEHTIRQAVAD